MRRDHEEIKDLLAAYVLGAMDQDEAAEIRSHVLSCDECMAEADALAGASSNLALAVEPSPLPAGFADRVLAIATAQDAEPESVPKRRRSFVPAFLTAASLGLAAVLGFQVYETQLKLERQEQVLGALLHQNGVELQGSSGAVARVVPSSDGSLFAAAGLQKAPPGHTYQLWFLNENEDPVSGGTFDVTGGIATLESDHSIEDFEGAAVTIEQAGGSAAPTTTPILSG